MGKTAAYFPAWVETLGSMIEQTRDGFQVAVGCERCRGHRVLDRKSLEQLVGKVGPSYSLVDRRCRCRLTPGCEGWNRFFYQSGCMRPLWRQATAERWIDHDYRVRLYLAQLVRDGSHARQRKKDRERH